MMRFGIEIEFVGDLGDALRCLRRAGIAVNDQRRTHHGFSETNWVVKRDGSVNNGGELVSPPLDFDNQEHRDQVTTALMAMQQSGCRPDPTAGIHVHVEAKHEDGRVFEPRELAAAVRFFHKFQDIFYRIGSSGWSKIRPGSTTYCKPIPESMATAMMKVRTVDALKKVWYGNVNRYGDDRSRDEYDSSRYHAINLHSFWNKGTVEFRVFNSSLNPDRVQSYIALACAVIRDVRNGYNRSVKKSYKLGGMASGQVDEDKAMLRFQQIMRYESGMSEQDWKNLRKYCWRDSVAQQSFGRTA